MYIKRERTSGICAVIMIWRWKSMREKNFIMKFHPSSRRVLGISVFKRYYCCVFLFFAGEIRTHSLDNFNSGISQRSNLLFRAKSVKLERILSFMLFIHFFAAAAAAAHASERKREATAHVWIMQ
jgi:hypothetical protein